MTAPTNSVAAFYETAVEELNQADLSYGHGCTCPEDEIAWLISATLDVPFDELDKHWSLPLSDTDRTTLQARLNAFMAEHVFPAEAAYFDEIEANTKAGRRWTPLQTIEQLKPKARAAGLGVRVMPNRRSPTVIQIRDSLGVGAAPTAAATVLVLATVPVCSACVAPPSTSRLTIKVKGRQVPLHGALAHLRIANG